MRAALQYIKKKKTRTDTKTHWKKKKWRSGDEATRNLCSSMQEGFRLRKLLPPFFSWLQGWLWEDRGSASGDERRTVVRRGPQSREPSTAKRSEMAKYRCNESCSSVSSWFRAATHRFVEDSRPEKGFFGQLLPSSLLICFPFSIYQKKKYFPLFSLPRSYLLLMYFV